MGEYKIYSLNDPITDEVRYIGKTVSELFKRLSSHYRDKSKSYKTYWIQSLKEKGLKPVIKLVEICLENNWEEREKYWISFYRQRTNLTNYLDGGQGQQKGYKHSEESKNKISIASKLNGKCKFFNGMKFSEEINNKRACSNKKSIYQFSLNGEMIKKWDGIIDASKTLNINKTNISSVLKGKTITAGGFRWSYNGEIESFVKNKKWREIISINQINNEVIEYNSIKEAAESLNIERKHVENSLRNNTVKFNLKFKYK
jgi:hypothetical protein